MHHKDNFEFVPNCSLGPSERENTIPINKAVKAIWECMVAMAAHNAFLKDGNVPTKPIISQLLLIIDEITLLDIAHHLLIDKNVYQQLGH